MTDAELRTFVADARAKVSAKLAEIDAMDLAVMPAKIRAEFLSLRQACLDTLATLTDEAIAAEVAASAYAGRQLTPAEIAALVRRQ